MGFYDDDWNDTGSYTSAPVSSSGWTGVPASQAAKLPTVYTNPATTATNVGKPTQASLTPGTNRTAAQVEQSTNAYKTAQVQSSINSILNGTGSSSARAVPTVSGSQVSQTSQAANVNVSQAERAMASSIGQAQEAQRVAVERARQAQQVNIADAVLASVIDMSPAEAIRAAQIEAAREVTGEKIDTRQRDEIRAKQMALLAGFEDDAAGKGTSAAQAQLQMAIDQAIANQMGIAAGSHGTGSVTANLRASSNIGSLSQQAAAQSAILRAQEIQQARQNLLTGYSDVGGMDLSLATNQAQFNQQANLANQSIEGQRFLQQAALEQQVRLQNQANVQQANMFNAGSANTASMYNAGQSNETARAQAALTAQISQFNAQQSNAQAALQAQLDSQLGMFNSSQVNSNNLAQAQLSQQANLFNSSQANDFAKLQAQIASTQGMFNAGQTNDTSRLNAQLAQQANLANASNTLTGRGLDDSRNANALNAYVTLNGQSLQSSYQNQQLQMMADQQKQQEQREAQAKRDKLIGGLVGGLAAGGSFLIPGVGPALAPFAGAAGYQIGSSISDQREKTDIGKLDDASVDEMLGNLVASRYRYKNPNQPGAGQGERFGIMAQDLEKSAMGKSLVIDDGGVKKIDGNQAVGALLAAMSRTHDRLRKLEARR